MADQYPQLDGNNYLGLSGSPTSVLFGQDANGYLDIGASYIWTCEQDGNNYITFSVIPVSFDAAIQKTLYRFVFLDASIALEMTKTVGLDAAVQKVLTKTVSFDARIDYGVLLVLDALISAVGLTKTVSFDARIDYGRHVFFDAKIEGPSETVNADKHRFEGDKDIGGEYGSKTQTEITYPRGTDP